jgi:hypothetical protein
MAGFALVVVIGAWLFGQPTDYRKEFRSAAQKDRESAMRLLLRGRTRRVKNSRVSVSLASAPQSRLPTRER